MHLQYPGYYCTTPMLLLVDNSDSPSIVEQSQQGCDSSCYTLLTVIPGSVEYSVPYACQLAFCIVGSQSILLFISSISTATYSSVYLLPVLSALIQTDLPFLCWMFPSLHPGIACLTVHPGIACLAFQASNLGGVFWVNL